METLLQKAVLEALGAQGQAQIVKEAVAYLTRKEGGYGKEKSPLMQILEQSAHNVARATLKDKLENDPEFIAAVQGLYADAIKRLLDVETREKLVEKIADGMSKAITGDSRY